jgi:hypothetical protein
VKVTYSAGRSDWHRHTLNHPLPRQLLVHPGPMSTRGPRRGLPLPAAIGIVIVILTLCCAVGFFAFWAIQGGTPRTLDPSMPPSSEAVP